MSGIQFRVSQEMWGYIDRVVAEEGEAGLDRLEAEMAQLRKDLGLPTREEEDARND